MSPGQKNDTKHKPEHRPPHFPFDEPPFRLSMGLIKIPIEEWFEIFDLQESEHFK